jgi:hypothetical protein
MVVSWIGSWLLRRRGGVWRLIGVGQLALYALAVIGVVGARLPIAGKRIFALPAHFCLANLAAAHAVVNVCRGKRFVTWEPERA